MQLDLREIINIPGNSISFDYQPDLSGLELGSVVEIKDDAKVVGKVLNNAGVLDFTALLKVTTIQVCARCLKEDTVPVDLNISCTISADGNEDECDDPDFFFLDGNILDLDEIINNYFVLESDNRYLCDEACKGLCPYCGADLNEGPCSCKKEIDPRLAVLGQLLEN